MNNYYEKARELHENENYEEALELYQQGIKAGDEKCWYGYAILLKNGYSVEKDYNKAMQILAEHYNNIRILADNGDALAMHIVGFYYLNGLYVDEDFETALNFITMAANAGDVLAMIQIAREHQEGGGLQTNPELAFKYYLQAAERGNKVAQFCVGSLLSYGDGTNQDYSEAAKWFLTAANAGDADAQFSIALLYDLGEGVEKNAETALYWYEKAAEQGNPSAQNNLGCMYENGVSVEQSYKKALFWYSCAADQGDAFAMLNIGDIYNNGYGVVKSQSEAVNWWEKAAYKDDSFPIPCYNLGYAYYNGEGVEQDRMKALEYFERAHKNGYPCSYAIDMIKNELARKNGQITHYDKSLNQMRAYADELLKQSIPTDKLPLQIQKDLKEDFGDYWNKLNKNTRKFLETALFNFITYYSFGERMYGNFDFSSVITPMFKALENEMGKYVYTGYIHYLVENNVSACVFPLNRTFIKSDGKGNLAYRKANDMSYFTLGSIDKVIGLSKNIRPRGYLDDADEQAYIIDKTFKEYLITLFTDDALGTINKERAIVDYIIDFSCEIKCLTDSIRNPAAHGNVMSCAKAEECGNHLIKVKKLLLKFIEKIKPEYFS